jgi:heme/copper-type cytochrome/quinol oxidase subunit 3
MGMIKTVAHARSASGVPTHKLAVWWLLCSEIVIFGGVLCSYLMHRLAHPEWGFDAAHTQTWIGTINTFVLLTSSLSAVLAHNAAEQNKGKEAAKYLWFTCGGGLLFLCIKAYEWSGEIAHGYTITASPFWSFYYTAAGIHASHVIAGMAVMVWVIQSGIKDNKYLYRVENVGLYWHFVDLVWIFLFPLLYIAK